MSALKILDRAIWEGAILPTDRPALTDAIDRSSFPEDDTGAHPVLIVITSAWNMLHYSGGEVEDRISPHDFLLVRAHVVHDVFDHHHARLSRAVHSHSSVL